MIKATRELKEAVGPGQRGGQDRLEPALGLPGRNPPKKTISMLGCSRIILEQLY